MGAVTHSMWIGPPCFPIFNERELTMEAVEGKDIVPFERSTSADMEFCASATWSANCEWYFIILPEGIALFNVYSRAGLLCRKHSGAFIGDCLKSGILSKSATRPRKARPSNAKTGE